MIDEEKVMDENEVASSSTGEEVEKTPESEVNEVPEREQEQESPYSSRAEERIRELIERVKMYEEALRALQMQQQQNLPSEDEDEYLDPQVKALKQEVKTLKMALATTYDQLDKLMTKQMYPDYDKYANQIEIMLTDMRRRGENRSRQEIYALLKAREVLSKSSSSEAKKVAVKKEKQEPIPETRSVKVPPKKPETLEEMAEKLKDVKF
jgi:hypothetical protein